jgi:hypothetical protein
MLIFPLVVGGYELMMQTVTRVDRQDFICRQLGCSKHLRSSLMNEDDNKSVVVIVVCGGR